MLDAYKQRPITLPKYTVLGYTASKSIILILQWLLLLYTVLQLDSVLRAGLLISRLSSRDCSPILWFNVTIAITTVLVVFVFIYFYFSFLSFYYFVGTQMLVRSIPFQVARSLLDLFNNWWRSWSIKWKFWPEIRSVEKVVYQNMIARRSTVYCSRYSKISAKTSC